MKLSIILPVYNVEKFLLDCFKSLQAQDIPKEEYEILCVDDGSPDNSVAVIEDCQKIYPNIRLIRQANSGVCSARNNGLKEARGEYVWFVDPDDYIQANCLGTTLNALITEKADLLVFGYDEVAEDSAFKQEKIENIIIEKQQEYSSMGSGCQYIVRRAYLEENGIVFNESLAYGEDYLWAFQINYRKHVGLKTTATIYHYRQRLGSAMHGKNEQKQLRHMNDMRLLGKLYVQEYERCKREELPKSVLKEIKRRKGLCSQAVIWNAVKLLRKKGEIASMLKQLEQDGLYPYRLLWWHLFSRKIQCNFFVRIIMFLFPIKIYVYFVNWVFRTVYKNKDK